MNAAAKGALAGLAATLPMTVAMELLWRRLPPPQRYPLPPREIIDRMLPAHFGEEESERVAVAVHFGFGATAGALYPTLTSSRRTSVGAAYGVGVWSASYLGWIPALGILTPAWRHPLQRNFLMIAVHLIWGASLAISVRELDRMDRDRTGRLARPGGLHPDAGSHP